MTKDVQTTGTNLPTSPAEMLGGLANMGKVAQQDGSGRGAFMKFDHGAYSYGREGIGVEKGSLWAINPNSFVHGYQAWGNSTLLGEHIANMNEPPIVKGNLTTHMYVDDELDVEVEAKWAPYRGFQLVCVTEGEDEGVQCLLSSSTMGMKNAVDKLVGELVNHIGQDPGTPVAIVELLFDEYPNKKAGGKMTQFPVFKVDEWADMEATEVPESEEEEETEGAGVLHDASDDDPGISDADLVGDEKGQEPDPDPEPEKPTRRARGAKAGKKKEPEKVEQKRRRQRRG